MIKSISVQNFKSLKNFSWDLYKEKKPKQLAVIYGENGAGKTNIIELINVFKETTQTLNASKVMREVLDSMNLRKNIQSSFLLKFTQFAQMQNITTIIEGQKTIGAKENMQISLKFSIKDVKFEYTMEFDDENIVFEHLKYPIVKNSVSVFKISSDKTVTSVSINQNVFKDAEYKKEIETLIKQYWGKHTLISILTREYVEKNKDFISTSIDEGLLNFIEETFKMKIFPNGVRENYLNSIISGSCKEDEFFEKYNKLIGAYSTMFNELYPDIYDVIYEYKKSERDGDEENVDYNMIFQKNIGGKILNIPAEYESKGTKKLIDLLPIIIDAVSGDIICIDEFDLGIHDILVGKILESISEELKGQLIITTHNTSILEGISRDGLKADDIYVLNTEYDGSKKINCLSEFNIKETNNPRDMYLRGEFGGISFTDGLDINDILANIEEV